MEKMLNDVLDEITTYIQIKDKIGKFYNTYDQLRIEKIEKIDLPEPYKVEAFNRKILVIGGGITGISSAVEAAKAGYDVTIVEKEVDLGGHALDRAAVVAALVANERGSAESDLVGVALGHTDLDLEGRKVDHGDQGLTRSDSVAVADLEA